MKPPPPAYDGFVDGRDSVTSLRAVSLPRMCPQPAMAGHLRQTGIQAAMVCPIMVMRAITLMVVESIFGRALAAGERQIERANTQGA